MLAWAMVSVVLAGAATILAWWHAQQSAMAQCLGGAFVWAGASLLAWRWWRAMPSGELAWDGASWHVCIGKRDGEPCHSPFVSLDLQSGLWVRLARLEGGVCWVWLARDQAPGRWLDLRRALFARQDERLRATNHLTEAEAA